jgi:hypothetical protein
MNGLMLPTIVSGIRSLKDGSVSVTLETQELSPSKAGELFSLRGKVTMTYLSPKDIITQKEIDQIDQIDADVKGKTQSQRIRSVLYLLHQQSNEGFKTFDEYYKSKTEMYIDHLKSKLT